MSIDNYYSRSEVSNSDLTELKNILHPRMQFGDKEAAFRFGTLVDALITEPSKVDYYFEQNINRFTNKIKQQMEENVKSRLDEIKSAFPHEEKQIQNNSDDIF